jgi:hypothetical protein
MMTATRATRNSPSLRYGQRVHDFIRKAIAIIKDFGPYAAIELILPGGSLIAVLLWLYRRQPPAPSPTSPP